MIILDLSYHQLIALQKKIAKLQDCRGKKFCHAMVKNQKKIKARISNYVKTAPKVGPEVLKKYQDEEAEIRLQYAKKDDKGEPVVSQDGNGGYGWEITDDEACNKAMEAHKDAHPKIKQCFRYEKTLKKAKPIKLYGIEYDDVPDNITIGEMDTIMPLILNAPDLGGNDEA